MVSKMAKNWEHIKTDWDRESLAVYLQYKDFKEFISRLPEDVKQDNWEMLNWVVNELEMYREDEIGHGASLYRIGKEKQAEKQK
jgi:hypothetical protein